MRLITLLLGWQFAFTLVAADFTSDDLRSDNSLVTRKHTNGVPLMAGPNDANIAKVTARILERSHYLKQPFNDEVSSRFLDRYLDALDSVHIYFFQSDLQEFEQYRTTLDDLTLKEGDTTPSRVIFTRFLERLQQQYDYVTNLLKTEKFEFNGNDRFLLNRKTLPRPRDLVEARQLWRERVRYEYLQEKLGVGRPEVIANIIREKLDQKKPTEIRKAIQDKVSKEKADQLAKIVQEKSGKEKPEAIVQTILNKLERENAEEIVKIITRRYTRVLRFLKDYDNDDVLQIYLTALCHVYDPHSDYMGKAELENFSIGMKLSLFGIGALLRSEDGICKIQELKPGPAQRSGKLKPNDKIIAVAQAEQEAVDVVDMPLKKVVELIRGPKGTEVRLTVIPADAPDPSVRKMVALVREEIKLEDQEAKAKLIELPVEENRRMRLGVIDLPSFYSGFELEGRRPGGEQKSTTTDVAKLIRKLVQEHIAGIILDLRRNGGGSLEEAINLTGLFIKEGPVVQVKDSDGRIIEDKDENSAVIYDGPLIVLTSRFSASASEILAGALQDYGRALIVGDSSTHGKGTVQSLIQLAPILRGQVGLVSSNNPGAVKITIRKFYRPSGSSTQLKGVTPDIVLPSVNNELEVGETSLENPLPWDPITPASYEKVNRVEAVLPELKKRTESRVAADRDFAYIREEIERYKKSAAERSVSMNEAQRLKEKQEGDDRAKARKKELAARPEPQETAYEIKLKDVDQPGLPAPETKSNHVSRAESGQLLKPGFSRETNRDALKEKSNTLAAVETARSVPADPDDPQDADEASAEDKIPALDVTLEETKRILVDFVTLSSKENSLAVTVPPEKKFSNPSQKKIGDPAVVK